MPAMHIQVDAFPFSRAHPLLLDIRPRSDERVYGFLDLFVVGHGVNPSTGSRGDAETRRNSGL